MSINTNVEDELFCLRYELNTLGMATSEHKLERWLPGFTDINTDYDHRLRYNWACQFAKGKSVLDIASGAGFGAYLLASKGEAQQVLGADIETDAIKYATIKYKHPALSFEQADATAIYIARKFSLIISFETIEHIDKTDLYLENMYRLLADDGLFIVSTPISALDIDHHPKNPYHVKEWGFKAFQDVLKTKFEIEKVFLQLYPPRPYTRVDALYHRFFLRNKPMKKNEIIEFNSEINTKQLGKQIIGYQILVCKKPKAK